MLTCETIVTDESLERAGEGFLDAARVSELEEHLAACPACAGRQEELEVETSVLRSAARLAVESTVRRPSRRRLLRWIAPAAAAAMALVLAFLLTSGEEPAAPRGEPSASPLVLEIRPAVAPGSMPPPCVGQCLLLADGVVLVEVQAVARDEERLRFSLRAKRIAVLHGPADIVPASIRIETRSGVSGLGVRSIPGRPGMKMVLLLRRDEKGVRLFTADTHSVVAGGVFAYLPSAQLTFGTDKDAERAVKAGLALRQRLEATAWEKQAPILAAALRGEDVLAREMALDWYSIHRTGSATDDMAWGWPGPLTKPSLAAVDAALVELLKPVPGRMSTLARKASGILSVDARERLSLWWKLLDDRHLSTVAYPLLRKLGTTGTAEERKAVRDAVAIGGGGAAPPTLPGLTSGTYLACGLLHEMGEPGFLSRILRPGLRRDQIAKVEGLHMPNTGRVWPPLAFLSSLADREFPDQKAAEAWIAEVSQRR